MGFGQEATLVHWSAQEKRHRSSDRKSPISRMAGIVRSWLKLSRNIADGAGSSNRGEFRDVLIPMHRSFASGDLLGTVEAVRGTNQWC